MNISEIILTGELLGGDIVVFAKRMGGRFLPSSEGVLLELEEEERTLPTIELSKKYCPGFDYFLEGFMINEMVEAMKASTQYTTSEQIVERIIYYVEFDA